MTFNKIRPGLARRAVLHWVAAASALPVAGCGALPQPWEKGILARPAMSFEVDGLEARFTDHVYASKEAASGGGAAGGAGCGCN